MAKILEQKFLDYIENHFGRGDYWYHREDEDGLSFEAGIEQFFEGYDLTYGNGYLYTVEYANEAICGDTLCVSVSWNDDAGLHLQSFIIFEP